MGFKGEKYSIRCYMVSSFMKFVLKMANRDKDNPLKGRTKV